MIEAVATGARALVVLASAHLIGTCLFLLRAGPVETPGLRDWNRRLITSLPLAAALLLLGLALSLLSQAAQIAGGFETASKLAMLRSLAMGTWYGQVWSIRVVLAGFALLLSLTAVLTIRRRAFQSAILIAAMAVAGSAALSGHASGTEDAALLVPLHVVHLLALCAWLGGLPAWIALARSAAHDTSGASARYTIIAMQRFSSLAMLCVSLMVLSGAFLSWEFIEDEGDLLGTRYGLLLCAKLLLLAAVLFIANRLRRKLLPQLERTNDGELFRIGSRHVRVELLLGCCVLALGAALAQTTPAVHDQAYWALPFRLSFEATWIEPRSRLAIILGTCASSLALGILLVWRRNHGSKFLTSTALAAIGTVTAIWGLSVPAYPDTFRRSPVPYLTLSIAQGRESFETYCTHCHGSGGLGDGVLAKSFPTPPANLSEPHTALHTAGDMYWWFTHGMPETPMPGFAEVLDEEQRWDLVNFLRAFSQGFQARVLGPQIVPEQPWLGAPNFYFEREDGTRAELKDFRRLKPALIVFDDPLEPRSSLRLRELRVELRTSDIVVLVKPSSIDVWQAYQLLTRTLADRGRDDALGMPLRHTEFLIDRFGYIRARWIPADEASGWDAPPPLMTQIELLGAEPEILPPPDLHLH